MEMSREEFMSKVSDLISSLPKEDGNDICKAIVKEGGKKFLDYLGTARGTLKAMISFIRPLEQDVVLTPVMEKVIEFLDAAAYKFISSLVM